MATEKKKTTDNDVVRAGIIALVISLAFFGGIFYYSTHTTREKYSSKLDDAKAAIVDAVKNTSPKYPPLDKDAYDRKLLSLANRPVEATSTATTTATTTKHYLWPAKGNPYPLDGAVLPFNRIIAYYGNFYSTKMGVLGEYPEDQMISMLEGELKKWRVADPNTPVVPAIHYIVTVAQGTAGADGDWTARMPDEQVQHALELGKKVNGIVFLDVQAGQSTIQKEVAAIAEYLKLPQVHLGIDPEFAMKNGRKPGEYIGTLDASEINDVIAMLSKIVDENNLPPKVLVVHRFTENMVTNANLIKPTKEVQVVMTMDGWGTQTLKTGIYRQVVASEPVQFTGIKLFYKNDLKAPSTGILSPEQVLNLRPQPSYIQYQ